MKITEDNYGQFYFGNANECYIQSEFNLNGYEASKPSPDIGYDLIVTNCARVKFLEEEAKQYDVQVKSTVCNNKGESLIYIDDDDFNMLCENDNGYLVCVFCEPEFAPRDGLIHVDRDSVENVIQKCIDNHLIFEWNELNYVSFKELKSFEGLKLVSFTRDYVWFNKSHLRRLINLEAFWTDNTKEGKKFGRFELEKKKMDLFC